MACFSRIFAVIMKTVLISLLLISVEPGTAAKVTPGPCGFTPEIEAEQGDNVTLQCCFGPQSNLKDRTVDWKRVDLNLVVHAYRHRKDYLDPQFKQYRNRTTLDSDAAEAICPKPLIEAEEGEDVFLRCLLDPSMDLSPYTVDWKRADDNKVVYSYRRGQENQHDQMEQYRNRSSLNLRDLSRGNMTLLISSVRLSDTGRYKCFVPKWWISCLVSLRVGDSTFKIVSAATVIAAFVILPVGFLVWIRQKCWRRLRGKTRREAETEDGHELKSPNGGNGLGDNK